MKRNGVSENFDPKISFPGYLLRKELLKGIQNNSHYLNGLLMDFGCGSKPYKSIIKTTNYIGVDYNGEGHSHENENIDVFYDGHKLPFPDNYFDSVFSSEVFEHIFNLEEIIPEIHRVMKSGAHILVTCPFAIAEHEQPNDFARYTSFGLTHLFEKNNFEIIKYEKIGTHFQTIMQLRIMYIYMHVLCKLNKLLILRPWLDKLVIGFLNIYSIVLSKVLPKKDDLYMNNLIVCRKK